LRFAGLGILLSVASGLPPALRATAVSPVSVLRSGLAQGISRTSSRTLAAAGLAILAISVVVGLQRQGEAGRAGTNDQHIGLHNRILIEHLRVGKNICGSLLFATMNSAFGEHGD